MRKMPDINGQGSYITWIHVTAQILDIATKTVRIKTPNTSTELVPKLHMQQKQKIEKKKEKRLGTLVA
ncbi:hypothetical protein CMV_000843 [Castanea mollissima]|uniref:Uncharacterized protein n=1 Tax=Castanea mollissima TaxID=60419 RepID=A0A8J4RYK9_9ROSI|nr:hypothetical protein CMV_000843 [Castanea mollissima]